MGAITPQEIAASVSAIAVSVAEEVQRINGMLQERVPFSRKPRYFDEEQKKFIIRMDSGDKEFLDLVVQEFCNSGWDVDIVFEYSQECSWYELILSHEVLRKFPRFVAWYNLYFPLSLKQGYDR